MNIAAKCSSGVCACVCIGLTPQQRDRSVSYLFRSRGNFSAIYRLEMGAAAIDNRNNTLYDRGNGPDLRGKVCGQSRSDEPRDALPLPCTGCMSHRGGSPSLCAWSLPLLAVTGLAHRY